MTNKLRLYDIDEIWERLNERHSKYCYDAAIYIENIDKEELPNGVLVEVKARCMKCADKNTFYIFERSYND